MKHGLSAATAAGVLLTSVFVSPVAATAVDEPATAIGEPAASSQIWNAIGQLAVDLERHSGHADGAPQK